MFNYLYYTIFPYLFGFASKLIGLANISLSDFQIAIQLGNGIPYTDLLTGVDMTMNIYSNTVSATALNVFIEIVTFGIPNTVPLWVALVLACINGFIVVSIIKFVLEIILELIPG